jgi:hypothetical protein
MSFWENIRGTAAEWFGLGGEPEIAIGKDVSGNMVFKDQVVGVTKTLTELSTGASGDLPRETIGPSDVVTIPQYRQYVTYHRGFNEGRVINSGLGVTISNG